MKKPSIRKPRDRNNPHYAVGTNNNFLLYAYMIEADGGLNLKSKVVRNRVRSFAYKLIELCNYWGNQ